MPVGGNGRKEEENPDRGRIPPVTAHLVKLMPAGKEFPAVLIR